MKIKYVLIVGLILISSLISGCYATEINEELICSIHCDGEFIYISGKQTYSPDVHCTSGDTNLSYIGRDWSGLPVGVKCE